jgi:hypothetical protein
VHESGWAGLGVILGSGGGHRRASRFEAGTHPGLHDQQSAVAMLTNGLRKVLNCIQLSHVWLRIPQFR